MLTSRLITLPGLAALTTADGAHPYPVATVRDWIARDERGFRTRCVVMLGGKLHVDLDALDRWNEDGRGLKRRRKTPSAQPVSRPRSYHRPRLSFDEMEAALRHQAAAPQTPRDRGRDARNA